jgi:hypothetical protein
VIYKRQELLTLHQHLDSTPVFGGAVLLITQNTKKMSNMYPTKTTTQKTKKMSNTAPPKTQHRKLKR